MGATDHGTQNITIEFFEEATSFDVNKRNVNIVPRGIYSGGHLTRVSDIEVTLSAFTAEIGDDDIQISVQTSALATLNAGALDSGDIDEATPYLVLRWGYQAAAGNFVEVHAIASAAAAQDNDLIIGKCVFSGATLTGFDYSDRTFLNVQDLFLRVEADSGLYVWVRAGRIHSSTGSVFVPEQRLGPFTVPGSPNSRIDLVHIESTGNVAIHQGTAAVSPSAPDYNGRLVVAEVRVVNGDTSIPASQIQDVRSFITAVSSALAQGQQVTASNQISPSTSESDVSGMSITMTTRGGIVLVDFTSNLSTEDGREVTVHINIDGDNVITEESDQDTGGQSFDKDIFSMHWTALSLSAGSHTFKIRWKIVTGTGYMNRGGNSDRVLSVVELPS
jgi:hypothetical protein